MVKDYAEEGHSEMDKFAIPSFDEVTGRWKFTWREDKKGYFNQDNFNQLVISYIELEKTLNSMKWIYYYMIIILLRNV